NLAALPMMTKQHWTSASCATRSLQSPRTSYTQPETVDYCRSVCIPEDLRLHLQIRKQSGWNSKGQTVLVICE
ncbi:putative lipid kinase YegS-like, partial [Clarias magur]